MGASFGTLDDMDIPEEQANKPLPVDVDTRRELAPETDRILDIGSPVRRDAGMEAVGQDLGERESLERYVAPIREAQVKEGQPVTTESVLDRAEAIRDVVERPLWQGGQRIGPVSGAAYLGLKRTLYTIGSDILDGLSGVANMATDGRWAEWLGKEGHRDKLEKYKNDLIDRGVGETSAAFSSIIKMWQDAPEFDEPDEFIQKYVNSLGKDQDLYVSKREADEITQYFGEGTGIAEKIVRAVPEAYGLIKVAGAFALRGGKKIVNEMQDLLDNAYKDRIKDYKAGDKSLFDANAEDYAFVLEEWSKKAAGKSWFRFFGLSERMRTNMFARRANRVMDNAKIPQRIKERNAKIADARKKIDLAEGVAAINPRASREIVANQNKQIKQLERGYLG